MSILAADRKAIPYGPVTTTPDLTACDAGGSVVHDYKKITMNPRRSLALAIAGYTQDHYYTQSLERSVSIDEGLWIIRKHMEGFLRIHDRFGLSKLTDFMVNQGIATFFDQEVGVYFSNAFLFSPVHSQIRLHRAKDGIQIFHAGSGSEHFEKAVGPGDIDSFIVSTKNSCTPETCIPWIQDVYKRVSAIDAGSGSEAVFVASTRSNPKFRSIQRS
jgi:hypothetical protein